MTRRSCLHRSGKRWQPGILAWVSAIMALAGVVALVYSPAASWLSQYNQSQLIRIYSSQVTQSLPSDATDDAEVSELMLARAYNDELTSGASVIAGERVPRGSGSEASGVNYDEMLAGPGGVMARIRIPSIDVDLPIYHGTSEETLLKGVGHLQGTSLPIGGDGTHAVLTAHRGLAQSTLFSNLDEVSRGDTFTIEVFGDVLTYRVITTQVVDPDDTQSLLPQDGRDLVTLVTCTPLGINSQRILVTGERVTPTPISDISVAGQPSTVPHFPWWIVYLLGGMSCVTLYVWRAGYRGDAAPVQPPFAGE